MGSPIPLLGTPYRTRDPVVAARRCVNLYPEKNGEGAPFPVTHWPTPGIVKRATTPNGNPVRGSYTASNGELFVVSGSGVYFVAVDYSFVLLGQIAERSTPVYMADNGLCVVLCDGSATGYAIDITRDDDGNVPHTFGGINDAAFYGANRVDYVDTYFVFNRPSTNQWYISKSEATFGMLTQTAEPVTGSLKIGDANVTEMEDTSSFQVGQAVSGTGIQDGTTILSILSKTQLVLSKPAQATIAGGTINIMPVAGFDSLDIVAKTGGADNIATIIVKHAEVWLIGELTSEVWYNAGAADFAFSRLPGSFIDHGCVARSSVAKQDVSIFWLSKDREGQGIVVRTDGYGLKRISTHALEEEMQAYGVLSDAVGFCFQKAGHAFYALTFPTADKTWVYDLAEDQWHEWAWADDSGNLHRHRANTHTFAYGRNTVGDWQNGSIYSLEGDVYTDDGRPVVRLTTFPHVKAGGDLLTVNQLIADMQVGSDESGGVLGAPEVTLRYSPNRGAGFSEPLIQTLGEQGAYDTLVTWWQLGCGRDFVFEISWAAPLKTVLNGAYIRTERHAA